MNAVLPKQELSGIWDLESFEKAGNLDLTSRQLFRKAVLEQTVDVNPHPALGDCNMVTIRLNNPRSDPWP